MTSTFYKKFEKTSHKVIQNHTFEPDTIVKYGDIVETLIPHKGPHISRLYVNLLGVPIEQLEYIDFIYNQTKLFRWSGDSYSIEYYLKTPYQKQNLKNYVLTFDTFDIPILQGMKIHFKVNDRSISEKNFTVSADYIYTKKSKDGMYLIEQTQKNTFNYTPNIRNILNFRNICKELYFVIDGVNSTFDKFDKLTLYLNNVEKVSDSPIYFRLVQPFTHHTSAPLIEQGVCFYVYSFGLTPEMLQPSGGINTSRIQNISFMINPTNQYTPKIIDVYAKTYNIFFVKNEDGHLLNNFL